MTILVIAKIGLFFPNFGIQAQEINFSVSYKPVKPSLACLLQTLTSDVFVKTLDNNITIVRTVTSVGGWKTCLVESIKMVLCQICI